MSVAFSFGKSEQAVGEDFRNGSRGSTAMNLQFRSDLGKNPQRASESPSLRPLGADIGIAQASRQTNILLAASSTFGLTDASILSTNSSPSDGHRQAIIKGMEWKNFGSSIPSRSSEDSVRFSSTNFRSPGSMARLKSGGAHNRPSLQYGHSLLRCQEVQLSDLPIVCGASAFRNPFPSHDSHPNGRSFNIEEGSTKQLHFENRENEQSKRFKRALEELKKELLSDDTDFPSSVEHVSQIDDSLVLDRGERDWADVIEDLLSENASLPSQASELNLRGQQVFSCSSRISNSQSKGQGSLASEGTSEANASGQTSPFPQQQTPPQGSEVTSVTFPKNPFTQQQAAAGQSLHNNTDTAGHPKQLLISCASAIAENDFVLARSIVTSLKQVASIYGDPVQRLAAYMTEALVCRLESSSKCLPLPLKGKEFYASEILPAMQVLHEACPYFEFGYKAANSAIIEAFKDEEYIHIIDFEIGQGKQWISLIKDFAARPGGPPKVRITGANDPQSTASLPGGLLSVGKLLGELARSVGVPFEFHPLKRKPSEVESSMLPTREGEALAVNFAFQLYNMPDESVCITNPRDRLLQMVRALNPKIVTLVEFEANTNTAPFYPRFLEALVFYTAIFESLDVSLPRESRERVNIERNCLAKDIMNIISCEGPDRVQRYEVAGKWRVRMTMAGFRPYPLSSYSTVKSLLEIYSKNYRLKEEGGALHLGWLDRILIVASFWQ